MSAVGITKTLGVWRAANDCTVDETRSLDNDADYQVWLDARTADAMASQDAAEFEARRWGPEPEFMLAVGGSYVC
jgi:hypothetical protein